MTTAINAFSSLCTCIALDAPGYGMSDDVIRDDPDMTDYAETVVQAANALGIDKFFVYGAATGAQIAIELGNRYPERMLLVMLDANGHVSDEDRPRMLSGYFPDVTPRRDGGHLLTYWDMCASVFASFPWNSERKQDRLAIDRLPATAIHAILLRYLRAGTNYAKAYKPAFMAEDHQHLAKMKAPATMTRWAGSPVVSIADDLIALGIPDNIELLQAGPSVEQRFAVQVAALRTAIQQAGSAAAPYTFPDTSLLAGKHRSYVETSGGQIHVLCHDAIEGEPVFLLHAAGGSSRQMWKLAKPYLGKRPVFLIDLPGHGATSWKVPIETMTLDDFAKPIVTVVQALCGMRGLIIGHGLGGAVALAIQAQLPDTEIQIVDPVPLDREDCIAFLDNGLPDLAPRESGAHLIEAWTYIRQSALSWPWYDGKHIAKRKFSDDISADALHDRTVDVLMTGGAFGRLLAFEATVDWATEIAQAIRPVGVKITTLHPCPAQVPALLGENFYLVDA